VPLHESHAVDVSLGGESNDGEAAVGGGGLSAQEPVHGFADAGAFFVVLLVHARASAVWAVASWVSALARSLAALTRRRLAILSGEWVASCSISSARCRSWWA
jgi:hypothetical protein